MTEEQLTGIARAAWEAILREREKEHKDDTENKD